MDDSIPHPPLTGSLDLPAWKSIVSVSAAILLAFFFVLAGTWKITDPYGAATRMIEMKVPANLGLPFAILLGAAETFSAVLLAVPRFRRWGAWMAGALLVVFMAYIGWNYTALRGADCSCFPAINLFGAKLDFKRAVGPEFFIGDALMLLLAVAAGAWARASAGFRTAATIMGAICVFAAVSFGIIYARQTGTKAPDSITVDGKPFSLQNGRAFLFFFDPECSHCFQAAQTMSKFHWNDVKVIGIPTAMPKFAKGFLDDTKLKAGVSNDLEVLKKTFPFAAGPFGVALENGRQKQSFMIFEEGEPVAGLRKLGFVE